MTVSVVEKPIPEKVSKEAYLLGIQDDGTGKQALYRLPIGDVLADGAVPQPNPVPTGLKIENNKLQLTAKGEAVGEGVELPKTPIDTVLSTTSANPVGNKAVTTALNKKLNLSGGTMSGNIAMGGNDILNVKRIVFLTENGEWLNMGNHSITNLATPTADHHAATKKYVDDTVNSIPKTVDSELSDTSENAVQSKAIKSYIDGKKISQIVDCPAFTNQPTITETELNSAFVPWIVNYYYVHIIDSAAGTFKLMTASNDPTSCIEQTFTLTGLDTGNSGVLRENTLVDFLTVGENWQMRSAGVSRVGFSLMNSNYINVTFNGFSDASGYIHVLSITGVNNYDYSCATSSLSSIYPAASGYLFGATKFRKNILVSCNLDIKVQSKYIDFSGNYFYKKTAENKRTNGVGADSGMQSLKGVLYKNDMGALPISVIRDFALISDGLFLNGTELTAVGKERF